MEPILRKAFSDNYRAAFLAVVILLSSISGYSQYNPSSHVVVNDAVAPAQATPIDSRSMFYDGSNFVYRPYQSTSEVYSYLNLPKYRTGNFIIVIDSGGTLLGNGTFSGGTNTFWMFKDTISNSGLVELSLFGSNTCSGCLLKANNLSDISNLGLARSNLGLGSMAVQSTAALGTDVVGTWPGSLSVIKFNGQLPAYYLNYNNLTNTPTIPPNITLTTIGGSGPSTYNNVTGALNIPNYAGGSGRCLNCNADTIGSIPLNFVTFCNGCVLTLDSIAGTASWQPVNVIGVLPPNSGTGFRIYSPQLPGIRSLVCASGCTIDSTTNSGSLTLTVITSGSGTVTNFTAGNLSGLFTTSVTSSTTTPALTFNPATFAAFNIYGNNTSSPATAIQFAPNLSILNQWSGGSIGLLGANNTWTGTNTFNGGIFIGSSVQFSSDNTYFIGGVIAAAQYIYSRQLFSNSSLMLGSAASTPINFDIGGVNDMRLTSAGQLTLYAYNTPTSFTGTATSIAAFDATGNIIQIPATLLISAEQGLHASVTGDSVLLGGFFYQADTINTNGYGFAITNLPDEASLGAGDSVLVEKSGSKYLTLVPSSAIGGGGLSSFTSPNSTITIGGTLTAPTVDVNYAAFPQSLIPSANATLTLGDGFNNWLTANTHGVTSNNNLQFSVPTAHVFGFLVNSVTLAEITAGGSIIAGGSTDNNAFLQAAANTSTVASMYLAPSAGVAVSSPVNGQIWNDGTHLYFQSGGTSHDLLSAGSGIPSITGPSGGAQTGAITFAVSGTSVSATGLTIPGAAGTFTFTYPAAWDYGDNTRPANFNIFWGPQVGNTTLSSNNNMGIGEQVFQNLTSGQYNLAIGQQAGKLLTTGTQNLIIGWVSGTVSKTSSFNTMIGQGVMTDDTAGMENVAVGGLSWDLSFNALGNVGVGYQSAGAEQVGQARYNVVIGDRARANTLQSDSFSTIIGGLAQQTNLNHLNAAIGIGYNQENANNVDYYNTIVIGNGDGLGSAKGTFRNGGGIGHGLLFWKDSVFKVGTKSMVIQLADSGVTTANLATLPKIPTGLQVNRDSISAGTGSGIFVYVVADNAWEQIPTTWHLPSGGTSYTFAQSLVNTSGTVTLVGDNATPGNNMLYGTNGSGTKGWYAQPSGGSAALSSITAAVATNFIDNTTFKQRWSWTGLAGDSSFSLVQNTTAAAAGQVGFAELMEGANATSSITTTAASIGNYHSGTGAINYGLQIISQGGATNYGLVIPSASSLNGIGTTTPTTEWYVSSANATNIVSATTGSGVTPEFSLITANATGQAQWYANPSTNGGSVNTGFAPNTTYLRGTGSLGTNIGAQFSTGDIRFFTGGEALANLRGIIDSVGRWHIDTVTGNSLFNLTTTRANNFPGAGEGATFAVDGGIFTDNNSTGTVSNLLAFSSFATPAVFSFHSGVTYTNAATVHIGFGPVVNGSNSTITNSYSLVVDGSVLMSSTLNVTGLANFTNTNTGANLLFGNSSTPSKSAGTGAGTSPTISIAGTNMDGLITITTGTGPAGSNANVVTVTFAGGVAGPNGLTITLTPANANTAALTGATQVYVIQDATTPTGAWDIFSGSSALSASTTYEWNYHVVGY